jgi:hypothetical protein
MGLVRRSPDFAPVVVRSRTGKSPKEASRPPLERNSAMFLSFMVKICCLSTDDQPCALGSRVLKGACIRVRGDGSIRRRRTASLRAHPVSMPGAAEAPSGIRAQVPLTW